MATVSDMICSEMIHCAGPDSVAVAEERQPTNAESECSVGLHSGSYVEPCSEAACTRQQLLMAISLLKHLAHNSPAAGEALVGAGVMDTARRWACSKHIMVRLTKCCGADEA